MPRLNPTAFLLTPVLAGFVLLLMSVDNPFSIAFSAILLASQPSLIRWILAFEPPAAVRIKFGQQRADFQRI